MRIALCQINSQWEDRVSTKDRISHIMEDWGGSADCLIFPEMVLSGFSMRSESATLNEEDHSFFTAIAVRHDATVLYGGVENRNNCIFSVSPRRPRKIEYRKRHLFNFGGEGEHYEAGRDFGVIEVDGFSLALSICYDLRFAYHFWAQAKACNAFVVIASWPEGRREHWSALLRARAIENQAFVIGVNRVGNDPTLAYCGDSAIFGPIGDRRIECGPAEGVYCCDLDSAEVVAVRSKFRFLEDRLQ